MLHIVLTVYNNSLHKFLELLCILIHITADLSVYATEITCLKYTNTFITMWNFFIINDKLVTLTEYNKTQVLQECLKIIAHYLSNSVTSLFISLIADYDMIKTCHELLKNSLRSCSRNLNWACRSLSVLLLKEM